MPHLRNCNTLKDKIESNENIIRTLHRQRGEIILGSWDVDVIQTDKKEKKKLLILTNNKLFLISWNMKVNKERIHCALFISGMTYTSTQSL